MKSKYRMGWLFVCFDLAVIEKWQMKEANFFRKKLLDLGYMKFQNSIYVRSCVTYDRVESNIKNIQLLAPKTGNISIFYLTDKQWANSINIEKTDYRISKYSVKKDEAAPKQITFW